MPRADDCFRWWYLPSWLGLDAPCVVSTWTLAVSLATGESFAWESLAALFATVWAIYLLDRLFDVARCTNWNNVTGRMRFGREFRWLYVALMFIATGSLSVLLIVRGLPAAVLLRGSMVAGGMVLYLLLFVIPSPLSRRLPGKECFVGLFFALGAYAVVGVDAASISLLVGIWLLVAFNCLVIAARDRATDALSDASAASRWWPTLDRDLYLVGIACMAAAVGMAIAQHIAFGTSLAAGFALMIVLHRKAGTLSADAVRAIADFCLFIPWVWFAALFFADPSWARF